MDVLKKQLANIQQQLSGLSASQKMLTLSLVAIMMMTFIWWGRYAGTAETEPVFNQSLDTEQVQRIRSVLKSESIPFEIAGDKVLVPVEKKDLAVAALVEANAMPKNASGSYEDWMGKVSPFASPSMNDKMNNEYLQQRLGSILCLMKGVAEANVLIDPTHERYVGQRVEPSAAVSIRTKNGEGNKDLAKSVAYFVAASNAHMRPSRVSILIDGKAVSVRDPDPNLPDGDIDETIAKQEARYAMNVKEALSQYGSNVVAVVHAKIDLVTLRSNSLTYGTVKAKEVKNETESSDTTTPQAATAEPGAAPNTGLSVPTTPAPSANATTNTQKDKTENQVFADQTNEDKSKPAGEPMAVSAAVSIPRTFFVQEAKGADNSAKQPDPKEVQAAFESHKDEMIQMVMNAIGIADPKAVSISLGPDIPMLMATDGAGTSTSSGSGGVTSLTNHLKEVAVGALAVISLVMVSMRVKKSAPAPVIAATVEDTTPIHLGPTIDIAGEVSETDQALDGMELDEDAIKANQMVDQVSTMVKENPDAAATMVKRWLNRS